MVRTLDKIEKDAMALPEDQRITLAHRILLSTEQSADASAETLWEAEIVSRIERLDRGETELHEASDVFRELDNRSS